MLKLFIPTRNILKLYRHRSTKYLFALNLFLFIYAIYIYEFSASYENELGNSDSRYGKQTSLIRYYSLLAESVGVFQFMDKMRQGSGGDTSDKIIETEEIQNVWCNFLWFSEVEKPKVGAISNRFWQKMDEKNDIYLFGAYFDRRFDQRTPAASSFVRILGVIWNKLDLNVYCHIWWQDDDKPIVVKAISRLIWLEHWDPRHTFYNAYLFSCPLADNFQTEKMGAPAFVSLTSEKCATILSNLLTIYDGQPRKEDKKQTVVCVKGLDFLDDISLQLIEWFEANYIFGADKIVVYSYNVHPNVQK
uniref:Glycosyltransferase family 92 protein n=1 Tax=Romanomermis culicivorax TaxID=13658 RepID=A0A915I0Z8_ROMCU